MTTWNRQVDGRKDGDFSTTNHKDKTVSTSHHHTHSLNNCLIVPVLEQDGSVGYKALKNTMLGELAKQHDLKIPVIIKDLKLSHDNESWSERQWDLRGQLLELSSENTPEVFGLKLEHVYLPVLVSGSTKSRIIFLEERLADRVKALFTSPEELLSYGKSVSSEYTCYGLWQLEDVHVRVEPDMGKELHRDGIGEISQDLLEEMGELAPLIQFRAVRSRLLKPSISKGCLKLNKSLPARTIVFTEGQLKGDGLQQDWNGRQSLWLGVLRSYNKVGKCRESWTSIEIPGNAKVKEAEIQPSVEIAHKLMDIMDEPTKAAEYKGLLDRDEGFSKLDQILRIAMGSKSTRKLPPLSQHPYVRLGLQDLMAAKLRQIAVDGGTKWNYLLSSGTLLTGDGRAIKTNLYKPGTRLALRRYPILLVDSYGIVVGPSEHDQEVQIGKTIAEELMADHDGDMLALIDCELRYEATVKARSQMEQSISKTHERLSSTFWETDSVISRNVGSSGVGSCTYAMLSAKIAGQDQLAEEMGVELQKAVDSLKWSCRGDVKKASEVLNTYGLPAHIAHRHDKKQFKRPETTDTFDSPLWNSIVDVYKKRSASMQSQILPLSAFGGIFGNKSHGLSKPKYRHLVDVYRWYCSHVKYISALEDESYKQEKMAELFDTLRSWSADKDERYVCAAWMMTHSQSSRNNRAAFVFEVFPQLIEILAEVYGAEEVERVSLADQKDMKDNEKAALKQGMRSMLMRSGVPLAIDRHVTSKEDRNDVLRTVALVSLEAVTPDELSEVIAQGKYELKPNADRPLPALNANGIDVIHSGRRVAQVADADVAKALSLNGAKFSGCEVLTYRKSVKVVITN